MPIEGEWYTTTYRNVYVGWRDTKEYPRRAVEDSAIHPLQGRRRPGGSKADNTFTYAAVGTQYFASALAIDGTTDPWAVRPAGPRGPADRPVEKLGQPYDSRSDSSTTCRSGPSRPARPRAGRNGHPRLRRLQRADQGPAAPAAHRRQGGRRTR